MSESIILKIIEAVAAIATLLISGIISLKLGRLNHQINSRMDQLLDETKKSAKSDGKLEEKKEEAERKLEKDK